MRFEVVTIFPELIQQMASVGLIGKACEHGTLQVITRSPREHAHDKHRSVDDAPYGGGSGMVMMPEPLVATMESLDEDARAQGRPVAHRIVMSPRGTPLSQEKAAELAQRPALMLICGRYEGIDERVLQYVDEEISLGDFVLNGGEVAALAIIEAAGRLVPGVVGNAESLGEESHAAAGLLEYPQYTRPREFRGVAVPDVLLSGDHGAIARYRRRCALIETARRRPDLLNRLTLSAEEQALVDSVGS